MSEEEIPKPRELLAARSSAEQLFGLLRAWFDVPESVEIDLRAVDSAVAELSEPVLVMAMAMRKLQALHLISTPGVLTTTDVVLTLIQDLERALLQAPSMHLRDAAASTDWDAELAAMDDIGNGNNVDNGGDMDADDMGNMDDMKMNPLEAKPDVEGLPSDDEIVLFRRHHRALHEAARAVLRASDGQIRRLL